MTHETTTAAFVESCLAGRQVSIRLGDHQVDLLPGGRSLVVTFEPVAPGDEPQTNLERPVWGQAFLQKRGLTVLGVKRIVMDWYRNPELHRLFRALQASGWFQGFDKVIFHGPSMGGYAALAFAASAPGCTVLALNPQSTLAPGLVWFDQRYAGARASAWDGDFVDGAHGAAAAARVYVCYDPHQIRDRLQVERLPVHNRVNLRLPFGGHTTAQTLKAMGLLGTVFDQALAGTLDETGFRNMVRARDRLADYHCRIAERAVWPVRRQRELDRALAIEPGHPRALRLRPLSTAAGKGVAPPSPVSRWPIGMVAAERVPLVYLDLPKCGSTTIQNHMLYIAQGRYAEEPEAIHQHARLRRSREDSDAAHAVIARQLAEGAVVFAFVRDPGRRAYACFHEKIMHNGPRSFVAIRQMLERHWGLRCPTPGEPASIERQRANFAAFLRFVEANLADDTGTPRDPHWCPQWPMLARHRRRLKIDVVGKVENFVADMAQVLHKANVRRVPDLHRRPWRHPPAAFSYEEVITPELLRQLERTYEADYRHLGYGDSG